MKPVSLHGDIQVWTGKNVHQTWQLFLFFEYDQNWMHATTDKKLNKYIIILHMIENQHQSLPDEYRNIHE